jgi:hypothetical protein
MKPQDEAVLQRFFDTEEAIAQRILDAMAKADGRLVGTLDESMIHTAFTCCLLWGALRYRRKTDKWRERRRQRIVRAARALQKDLWTPEDIEWAKRVEQHYTPRRLTRDEWEKFVAAKATPEDLRSPEDTEWVKRVGWGIVEPPFTPAERQRLEGSALVQLVGDLAKTFEYAFRVRAGYTTDPGTNETDGPFIRFVEQVFHEFEVTRDGNQPYQRRSIADALKEFRRRTET